MKWTISYPCEIVTKRHTIRSPGREIGLFYFFGGGLGVGALGLQDFLANAAIFLSGRTFAFFFSYYFGLHDFLLW